MRLCLRADDNDFFKIVLQLLLFLIELIVSTCIAFFTFLFIEEPFRKIGMMIAEKLTLERSENQKIASKVDLVNKINKEILGEKS